MQTATLNTRKTDQRRQWTALGRTRHAAVSAARTGVLIAEVAISMTLIVSVLLVANRSPGAPYRLTDMQRDALSAVASGSSIADAARQCRTDERGIRNAIHKAASAANWRIGTIDQPSAEELWRRCQMMNLV